MTSTIVECTKKVQLGVLRLRRRTWCYSPTPSPLHTLTRRPPPVPARGRCGNVLHAPARSLPCTNWFAQLWAFQTPPTPVPCALHKCNTPCKPAMTGLSLSATIVLLNGVVRAHDTCQLSWRVYATKNGKSVDLVTDIELTWHNVCDPCVAWNIIWKIFLGLILWVRATHRVESFPPWGHYWEIGGEGILRRRSWKTPWVEVSLG